VAEIRFRQGVKLVVQNGQQAMSCRFVAVAQLLKQQRGVLSVGSHIGNPDEKIGEPPRPPSFYEFKANSLRLFLRICTSLIALLVEPSAGQASRPAARDSGKPARGA
jgi:hypothetical protein